MGIVEVGAEIDDARLVRDRDESSGDGDDVGDGAGDGGEDVGHGFVCLFVVGWYCYSSMVHGASRV